MKGPIDPTTGRPQYLDRVVGFKTIKAIFSDGYDQASLLPWPGATVNQLPGWIKVHDGSLSIEAKGYDNADPLSAPSGRSSLAGASQQVAAEALYDLLFHDAAW